MQAVALDELPGFPFEPRRFDADGGPGMHFIDEGVREHPVVLLLHGLPTWGYVYRRVIPFLVEAGCRAIAPDLLGCGKSDAPEDPQGLTYATLVERLMAFVHAQDLRDVTLVCEDLGAILGLRLVADLPDRFGRVVALNPALPGGTAPVPPAFRRWADLARSGAPTPAASDLVREQCASPLSPQVAAAYDAPFAGARGASLARLGALIEDPAVADGDRQVLARLSRFLGPLVVALSERDADARAAAEEIAAAAPGARWLEGAVVEAGGRLIAEDRGPELASAVLDLIRGTGR